MEAYWTDTALSQLDETELYLMTNFSERELEYLYEEITRTIAMINEGLVIHQDYEDMEAKKVIVAKYNTMVYKKTEKEFIIFAFLNNRKSPKENYQSIKKNTAK